MRRLFLVIFFFEVGLVLTVAPWSAYWDQNYFADWLPWLRPWLESSYLRGAVSGLGLINFAAGAVEFMGPGNAPRRPFGEPVISISPSSAVED
jgi:hypothetical protein